MWRRRQRRRRHARATRLFAGGVYCGSKAARSAVSEPARRECQCAAAGRGWAAHTAQHGQCGLAAGAPGPGPVCLVAPGRMPGRGKFDGSYYCARKVRGTLGLLYQFLFAHLCVVCVCMMLHSALLAGPARTAVKRQLRDFVLRGAWHLLRLMRFFGSAEGPAWLHCSGAAC